MIYLTQKVDSIPIGTKVFVVSGGSGGRIADKAEGVVCEKPTDPKINWPDYAGAIIEQAVCFVKTSNRIYGLASGCEVNAYPPLKMPS